MLQQIRIRNLGVIDESLVDLSDGFCVLTGETGAGKTMIITGLQLLRGGRADSGAVRLGADTAWVDGLFALNPSSPAVERAREAGAELESTDEHDAAASLELTVARSVGAGRSRAHLGGRTVPASVLGELADDLVAVHGQSEQVLLTSASRQRALLDGFAGPTAAQALDRYQSVFDDLATTRSRLAELTDQARQRRQEADLLRLGVGEIESVEPQPGEDHALRGLSDRLEHASELLSASTEAHTALVGTDDLSAADNPADVMGLLHESRRRLEQVADLDPQLAELAKRVADLGHLVVDLAADLAGYSAGVDADPATLATTHERRAALAGLIRKYGDDIDEVLRWSASASTRLLELDSDDDRIEELTTRVGTLTDDLTEAAGQLSAVRAAAAEELAELVSAELAELSMPGARFSVELTTREPARHGADEVDFRLAPHPGAPPRPLGKGASGGELSRVMLAIEVATVATTYPRTQVFDEVDAGVGGRAAVQIGRRLCRLAASAQVIVVTHLPQVAAYADQHLVVRKASTEESVTVSGVHEVSGAERVRELARMLAGQDDSTSAQDHAEELLNQADAERSTLRTM